MPRQLEIRTTILAKKSDCVRSAKDGNSNDVYPAEVLQMLEDLQKLKANVYIYTTREFVSLDKLS